MVQCSDCGHFHGFHGPNGAAWEKCNATIYLGDEGDLGVSKCPCRYPVQVPLPQAA